MSGILGRRRRGCLRSFVGNEVGWCCVGCVGVGGIGDVRER
jgi:hypothetical protein